MVEPLEVTPGSVARTRDWIADRDDRIVPLINRVRGELGGVFGVVVDDVDTAAYRAAVERVFADGDRGANVAALVLILRSLEVTDDHPGFIVDELLGRELAATIAGEQPLRLLAEATFHYTDATHHPVEDAPAGLDDLDAALAAGFQTRLPGWPWRERAGPFDGGA